MKIVLLAPPSVEGYYTASLLVSVVLRHEAASDQSCPLLGMGARLGQASTPRPGLAKLRQHSQDPGAYSAWGSAEWPTKKTKWPF